jgi:hypothetical protein
MAVSGQFHAARFVYGKGREPDWAVLEKGIPLVCGWIRMPDRPVHNFSLFRLRYPGSIFVECVRIKIESRTFAVLELWQTLRL